MDKRARLDAFLDEHDLAAVWFGRPNAFAWLTGGDNVVSREEAVGVAAAGYDGESMTVVTDNIESPRLADEELEADVEFVTYDWHADDLTGVVAATGPTPAAADFDVPGFESLDASTLRQPLTDGDIASYRTLGSEVAHAVEAACREADPDDTERDVAGAVAGRLTARGIDAPVLLVGGGQRARRYRHYTPTDATLGEYALVAVTATRDGLHASCTRTVAFDPPDWLAERHAAATRVETSALAATRAVAGEGGTAGDVFAAIQEAYESVGFPGEWRDHHQGGAAGYAGREWIATPDHDARVVTPMAYAWNPTVRGAKSEDTVLVADDGFEILTATGEWPTATFEAVGHEVSLERPEVLVRE
jgi:Xaa-Pro aminopeptidase